MTILNRINQLKRIYFFELPNWQKIMKSPKSIQNSQLTQNQNEIFPSCQNQQFLQIENYVFLSSKSAVLIFFIQKTDYRKCFKLLSQTFLIEYRDFQDKNCQIQLHKLVQSSDFFFQSQSLDEKVSYNEKQDFRKSFNGFTRRINQILFILVFRNEKNHNNIKVNEDARRLKFLFLNGQGKIIHILSNLALGSIEKLSKMITKFFRRLQKVYIFDSTQSFQECSLVFKDLQSQKVAKALIYISPFSRELHELSKNIKTFTKSYIFPMKCWAVQKSFSNLGALLLCQIEHDKSQVETNIEKTLNYKKIYDFITQKAFQTFLLTKISQNTLFTNEWLNSMIAWYFNIIQSFGDQLSLQKTPNQALKAISNKIATYFERKITKILNVNRDYNSKTEKCFPDLLTNTKVCMVCKKRKPKYGCLKCSNKYDMVINLCVEQCFKNFHKDHIKYLPKNFQTNEKPNSTGKLISILEKGLFGDQNQGKNTKNMYLESDVGLKKKKKLNYAVQQHRLKEKKITKAQKKPTMEKKWMKYKGFNLIDFFGMECNLKIEKKLKEQKMEMDQIKIESTQNFLPSFPLD